VIQAEEAKAEGVARRAEATDAAARAARAARSPPFQHVCFLVRDSGEPPSRVESLPD